MRTRVVDLPIFAFIFVASVGWSFGLLPSAARAAPGDTTLLSITPSGKGAYDALRPSVSRDGRWVAFWAESSGEPLVTEPVAPGYQSYVRDAWNSQTRRVGVAPGGGAANASVDWPWISADGRYVVYISRATNLVAGVQDGLQHVYIEDLVTGVIELVSQSSREVRGNGDSFVAKVNADGRYVAFMSQSTNLVAGDTNGRADVYVRDRLTGTTERVSVSSAGVQGNRDSAPGPTLSADGRYVSFTSDASNLVPGDTNATADAFVRDRTARTTERISVGPKGEQVRDAVYWSSAVVNADGRYVLFETRTALTSDDKNYNQDVYLRDRELGRTELISAPDLKSYSSYASQASISDDGRYVALCTIEPFDPADTFGRDVYVKDRATGAIAPANVTSDGEMTYGDCWSGMISGDGRYVAFADWGADLLKPEQWLPDLVHNVFLHEMRPIQVRFTLRPLELEFGPQALGSTTKKSFWLRNHSTSTSLPIKAIRLVGVDPGSFEVSHRCGILLGAGDGCPVHVLFKPTTVGAKSAAVRVSIAGAVRARALTGEGVR